MTDVLEVCVLVSK